MQKVKSSLYKLYNSDNIEALSLLKDNSIDACVCDPPYGMSALPDAKTMLKAWAADEDHKHHAKTGYMSSKWDAFVPQPSLWKEIYRVLKPGGWCLSFFSTRTHDIGTLAMRFAELEVRDCILWIYGTANSASQRMDRSLDKRAGIKVRDFYDRSYGSKPNPQTDQAKKWSGWGTNLRPACELVAMTRKPLYKNSYVDNLLKYGVGPLNVEAARIPLSKSALSYDAKLARKRVIPLKTIEGVQAIDGRIPLIHEDGRYPSHLILDTEAGKILDSVSPAEVSRFFYHPKVSMMEREWGTEGLPLVSTDTLVNRRLSLRHKWDGSEREAIEVHNPHPTVKPIALMRYLIKLVAPSGATVLDPFMGSGSTGIAALLDGCKFVGMEQDKSFFQIARTRIKQTKDYIAEHPTSKLEGLFS